MMIKKQRLILPLILVAILPTGLLSAQSNAFPNAPYIDHNSQSSEKSKIRREVRPLIHPVNEFQTVMGHHPLAHLLLESLQPPRIEMMAQLYQGDTPETLFDKGRGIRTGITSHASAKAGSKSMVWGSASYFYSEYNDNTMICTADADLLYPYVTMSPGQRTFFQEDYRLLGGASTRWGRNTIGLQFSYDAQQNFTRRDPRLRNIVGKLDGALSVRHFYPSFGSLYFTLHLHKYDQSGSVSYVGQKATVGSVYHLGMGNTYDAVTDLFNDPIYTGRGGSVDLGFMSLPFLSSKLLLNTSYTTSRYDRVLNDRGMILSSLYHRAGKVSGRLFHQLSSHANWTIGGDLDLGQVYGEEHLYGPSHAGGYPEVAISTPYSRSCLQYNVMTALTFYPTSYCSYTMGVNYRSHHRGEKYEVPVSELTSKKQDLVVFLDSTHKLGEGMLVTKIRGLIPLQSPSLTKVGDGFKIDDPIRMAIQERLLAQYGSKRQGIDGDLMFYPQAATRYYVGLSGGWSRIEWGEHWDRYNVAMKIGVIF